MQEQNLLRKKLSVLLMNFLVVAYLTLGNTSAWGQTIIAQWNGYTPGAPPANGIFLATAGIESNKGIAVLTRDASGKGYVVNEDGVAASTTFDNAVETEKYWIITFSTKKCENLTLTSKQRGSDTSPKDFKIQYLLDEVWSDLNDGTITVTNNTYTAGTKTDLPLPTDLNNKESVSLRWLCSSTTRINGSAAVSASGVSRLDVVVKGVYLDETTWTGASSVDPTDWNDIANWNGGVPGPTTNVTVSKVGTYPIIPAGTKVNTITFEAGAEIGNQQELDYQNAKVELDLKAGRWYMLSMPMAAKSEDFYFEGNPISWIRTFTTAGNQAGWNYIRNLDEQFVIGDGLALQLGADKKFSLKGSPLAGASISKTLNFGEDENLNSFFALTGNPFMTSIDFDLLQATNPTITTSYLIWTGEGFSGYNSSGKWGITETDMNQYIAPLQSFIVEKNTEETTTTLNFNPTAIQATNAGAILKTPENTVNKLDIIASNENASVLTFIADRENGQSSRKLMAGMNDVPDIYTLNGSAALGAHIIHTDDVLIPIGLATTYSGNISLTFNGMDNYDAEILFKDIEKGKEINISGLNAYEYSFEYIPKKVNDKVTAEENRFFVQIRPVQTGWDNSLFQDIAVYSQNKTIRVVSGSSDRIRQVLVYNAQGVLVYADENVNASSYTVNRHTTIPEVCIVKLITGQGIKTVRVFVK
jgi:hypothetical protein